MVVYKKICNQVGWNAVYETRMYLRIKGGGKILAGKKVKSRRIKLSFCYFFKKGPHSVSSYSISNMLIIFRKKIENKTLSKTSAYGMVYYINLTTYYIQFCIHFQYFNRRIISQFCIVTPRQNKCKQTCYGPPLIILSSKNTTINFSVLLRMQKQRIITTTIEKERHLNTLVYGSALLSLFSAKSIIYCSCYAEMIII
jgi:hypothetical protein